jgi:uncharacterized membrane protein (DUF373 family)
MDMKGINRLLVIISIVMLGLTAGNFLMLSEQITAISAGAVPQEWMAWAVAAFLVMLAFLDIAGLILLVLRFHRLKKESIIRSAAFVPEYSRSFCWRSMWLCCRK